MGVGKMSDYHVLDLTIDGGKARARVAMHIPVPVGTNVTETVSYVAALKEFIQYEAARDGLSNWASEIPNHATDFAAENADLANGLLFERVVTVDIKITDSNVAKRAAVEAAYTAAVSEVQGEIQKRLWGWGLNGDVV